MIEFLYLLIGVFGTLIAVHVKNELWPRECSRCAERRAKRLWEAEHKEQTP